MNVLLSNYPNTIDCKDNRYWRFNNLLSILDLEGVRLKCIQFGNNIQIEDEYYDNLEKYYFANIHLVLSGGDIRGFAIQYPNIDTSMFLFENNKWTYWGIDILVCDFVDIEQIDPFEIEGVAKGVKVMATLKRREYTDYSPCFKNNIFQLFDRINSEENLFNVFDLYSQKTEHSLKEFINYSLLLISEYTQDGNRGLLNFKQWFINWVSKTIKIYDKIISNDLELDDFLPKQNIIKEKITINSTDENKTYPIVRKELITIHNTSRKELNHSTKLPLVKLTTSDFPNLWCYGDYMIIFDETIQRRLKVTSWNTDLEDCFIDFGSDSDATKRKKEIVDYSEDKPLYFNLYRLEIVIIDDIIDEIIEKIYVADHKKINSLIKSFLRTIPIDYPYYWKDDRPIAIKKKGDQNNNVYSFLQFHFGYFDGYKEDFINNLIEVTGDIWNVRTRENQVRKEILNEWIKEKIEEYDLDRSKLGLESQQITPEPTTTPEPIKLNDKKPSKKDLLLYYHYTKEQEQFITNKELYAEITKKYGYTEQGMKNAKSGLNDRKYLNDKDNLSRLINLLEGQNDALERLNNDLILYKIV